MAGTAGIRTTLALSEWCTRIDTHAFTQPSRRSSAGACGTPASTLCTGPNCPTLSHRSREKQSWSICRTTLQSAEIPALALAPVVAWRTHGVLLLLLAPYVPASLHTGWGHAPAWQTRLLSKAPPTTPAPVPALRSPADITQARTRPLSCRRQGSRPWKAPASAELHCVRAQGEPRAATHSWGSGRGKKGSPHSLLPTG